MKLKLYNCTAKRIKLDKTSSMTLIKTIDGTIPDPYNIGMSMIDPEFVIESSSIPSGFNYAKIEDLGKFYFVDEPEWINDNQWRLKLHLDRRMTYKTEIGGTTALITRYQGSDVKDYFTDPLFKPGNRGTQTEYKVSIFTDPYVTGIAKTWTASNLWGGQGSDIGDDTRFLIFFKTQPLGIRKIGGTYGATDWDTYAQSFMVADRTGISKLLEAHRQAGNVAFDMGGQIGGILAFPFNWGIQTSYEIDQINFGSLINEATIPKVDGHSHVWLSGSVYGFWTNYTGKWRITNYPNLGQFAVPPYTEYTLRFAPWGEIRLDPTIMANTNTIDVIVECSGATGIARLKVIGYENNSGTLEYIGSQLLGSAQIGLEFPVVGAPAVNIQNIIGTGIGVVGGVASGVATGGIGAGVAALIGGAAGIAMNSDSLYTPGVATTGSGGFVDDQPCLVLHTKGHSTIDPADSGYIYNKTAQISTLTGFCICGEVHITPSANMTNDDVEDIERFLKTEGVIV